MRKKMLTIALATIVLCTSIVLGSYALLTARTNELTNVFVSAKNISAEVTETKFKPTEASNYLPGDNLDKNPTIKNTSEDNSIYAAIKISYTSEKDGKKEILDVEEFKKYATIEGMNTTDWELISTNADGEEVYFYKKEVKPNESAKNELFQSVKINLDIPLENGKLPKFNIKISGYATQYKNVDRNTAITALKNMADANK